MKKIILLVCKRIIIAVCELYAFNLMVSNLNILVPINFITVGVLAVLGLSGLISLVAIFFVLQ